MDLIVATWMYSLPSGDTTFHPQIGRRSDTEKARNFYWRCVFCLFASVKAMMPATRNILLLNEPPPAEIDGQDTTALCERFAIEQVELTTITRPPPDYHKAWNTQFIVLDALDSLCALAKPDTAVLLLDSDCIVTKPLPPDTLNALSQQGALTYRINYEPDEVINGLTNRQFGELCRTYDPPFTGEVTYCGGEIIFLSSAVLPEFARRARRAYEQSLARHRKNLPKFCEEAYLLTYVYHSMGIPLGTANHLIRRIWTDRSTFCNVAGDEDKLSIWHLPAEKKKGFLQAFQQLKHEDWAAFFHDTATLEQLFHLKPTFITLQKMRIRGVIRRLYLAAKARLKR